jgi:hypothetical protein
MGFTICMDIKAALFNWTNISNPHKFLYTVYIHCRIHIQPTCYIRLMLGVYAGQLKVT